MDETAVNPCHPCCPCPVCPPPATHCFVVCGWFPARVYPLHGEALDACITATHYIGGVGLTNGEDCFGKTERSSAAGRAGATDDPLHPVRFCLAAGCILFRRHAPGRLPEEFLSMYTCLNQSGVGPDFPQLAALTLPACTGEVLLCHVTGTAVASGQRVCSCHGSVAHE